MSLWLLELRFRPLITVAVSRRVFCAENRRPSGAAASSNKWRSIEKRFVFFFFLHRTITVVRIKVTPHNDVIFTRTSTRVRRFMTISTDTDGGLFDFLIPTRSDASDR